MDQRIRRLRGLHGPDFSGPVSMAAISARIEIQKKFRFGPGPKPNTKFWPGPGPANFFFSDFHPNCLVLSDFKTGTHNKCIFFLVMIYFSAICQNNQFSVDCFQLTFIKRTSYYRNTKNKIYNWTNT